MKQARNICLGIAVLFLTAVTAGCNDPKSLLDQNAEIVNHNWSYLNNIKYDVKIDDPNVAYNLYFNLRVTGDYKYANMFVLMHTSGPGIKKNLVRYELPLADNRTGEWLGSGSGNLYSYQIPFAGKYHFPAKGVYHFEIEQNMRDNPLHEVSDVGLRVEKAQ